MKMMFRGMCFSGSSSSLDSFSSAFFWGWKLLNEKKKKLEKDAQLFE